MAMSWSSIIRISLLLLLLIAITTACLTLPVEKILKDFLYWIEHNLGAWGPLVLVVAYIPLTVLAVPASVLTWDLLLILLVLQLVPRLHFFLVEPATGRGFVVFHAKFADNYRLYSRSHFVKGLELMILLIVYEAYGNCMKALPLVSTFWGILLFVEYRKSWRRTYVLLVSMLLMFIVAVAILMASSGHRKT